MIEGVGKIVLTLALAIALIALLPGSPIQSMLAEIGEVPFLSQINWLIPIHKIYAVTLLWLTCIGAYYLIAWLLRQLGIID